jgi:DNA transformation protein
VSVQETYLAYVLEQLAGLGSLRSNRMFGGIGLYSRQIFFGLIDDDALYFKTDESNIAPYQERGMKRFMPFPDRPEAVLGYHEVPADVIEDAEQLVDWARRAVDVALRRHAERSEKRRKPARPHAPAKKSTATRKAAARKPVARKRAPGKSARAKSARGKSASKTTAQTRRAGKRARRGK